MRLRQSIESSPKTTLFSLFLAWKSLILAVAFFSPGRGYDTSASISQLSQGKFPAVLIRWDAIYMNTVSKRDYLFEQEWAFSWGFTRLNRFLTNRIVGVDSAHQDAAAWTGIVVSHFSHLLAVFLLYNLTLKIFAESKSRTKLAFVAAGLHIVSPGGIFLSAPYSESSFAAIQFLGWSLYVSGTVSIDESLLAALPLILSGMIFGVGVTVRSNGLLSGIPFAIDALAAAMRLASGQEKSSALWRLAVVVIAGACIIPGAVLPQFLAWQRYCGSDEVVAASCRWCKNLPPSIYTYVQSHYWDNGLFKYWTMSNIPLFAIAAPVLYIMGCSCVWAMTGIEESTPSRSESAVSKSMAQSALLKRRIARHGALQRIAVTQMVLTALILFQSHVQIIQRVSSGYPVWYMWLAYELIGLPNSGRTLGPRAVPKLAVRWIVAYAIVQGGLYSAFLPPA